MRSGYHIVIKDHILRSPVGTRFIWLKKGDWLVTDGTFIGRFDKDIEVDWLPLEWTQGVLVTLEAVINTELEPITVRVPLSRLDTKFRKMMFVEPGEPIPEMPTPSLHQLESYLRLRKNL